MKTLKERLEDVKHRRIDLTIRDESAQDNTRRPEIVIWPIKNDDKSDVIVNLMIAATWGASNRFVDLTTQEARRLANLLIRTADEADHIKGQYAADQVKAEGGSAMDQACAQITATFGGIISEAAR